MASPPAHAPLLLSHPGAPPAGEQCTAHCQLAASLCPGSLLPPLIMLLRVVAALGSTVALVGAATPRRFLELWGDEDALIDGVSCELDEDTHVCPRDDVDGTSNGGRIPGESCCVTTHVPYGMDPSLATCGGTRPTGLPFAGRSPVYAQHGIAATSVPLSTMCAIDILKAGGSAVDAAIAANACENVVEPMMNGMGGDLMAQVWHGPTKTLHGYNGAGRSPEVRPRCTPRTSIYYTMPRRLYQLLSHRYEVLSCRASAMPRWRPR